MQDKKGIKNGTTIFNDCDQDTENRAKGNIHVLKIVMLY